MKIEFSLNINLLRLRNKKGFTILMLTRLHKDTSGERMKYILMSDTHYTILSGIGDI
jgi:hypothetical protein